MQEQVNRSQRGFFSLVALQAQGAFNDSVFKMILILYAALLFADQPGKLAGYTALIMAMIPGAFLIFACWAGMLADKYSKRTVILITKVVELGIVAVGFIVFALDNQHAGPNYHIFAGGLIVGFLLFVHSAFFSPSKYGIIPELVPEERITWANGIISLTTFLAIILGTAGAAYLFQRYSPDRLERIPALLIICSAAGLLLGFGIARTSPANPHRPFQINYFPELKRYVTILFGNRTLGLTVIGLSYFWAIGNMLLGHMVLWGTLSLKLTETQAGGLFVLLALGIGLGSALAGFISRDRIETGLIPLGSLGIALFALPLIFANEHNRVTMITSLFLLGISAGFYSVPLNAILQSKTDKADRGGLLAATSYFTDGAMLLSSGVYWLINYAAFQFIASKEIAANTIFIVISTATLIGTIIVLKLLPESLLRLVSFILTRSLYRIRIVGKENIPAAGPALLVSNHTSFVDALLINTIAGRPVRFIVWEGFYNTPILRSFLSILRSIPISSDQKPRQLITSLKKAGEVLQSGELLCIFAEGQITRIGGMLPFQRGYQFILKDAPAPVVPVYLHGVWGSIFSFDRGKFFFKWPRRIPYRVSIAIGRPLPPDVDPFALRQAIEELGADAAIAAKPDMPLVHHKLISAARRHPRRFLMTDMLSPRMTVFKTLVQSIILARRLAPKWEGQETVGIFLPPSVAGATVNYAATLSGRTVVNLNYTTGPAVLESCARQCDLKTVVTAKPFLEKVNLQPPGELIYIEEYRGFRGVWEAAGAVVAAALFPVRWVERYCRAVRHPNPDTLATIIFSSGSTGEPKGVMLSHFNIASNIESFHNGIRIFPHDRILGTLPFFHSFGYTVQLWGSVINPFGCVYHLNPLDLKIIGDLCEKQGISVIITTPTFLQNYLRRINPPQFGGLNAVISGAEKLPDRLRTAFLEKFGVEPLQGYGTTECAPVVSTNVDDFRSPGFYQVGHKRGSIGHPLPGIAVKVVDVETGRVLVQGEPGLLMVKGPNVMQGYLGKPEKTAEVIQDGWYNTGDIAYVDEDGFIFITDRLSRFSKIGGEMAPHVSIEDKLHEALGLNEQALVVTAVPDERKGEQLVVLHTLDVERLNGITEKLAAAGLPNLWIPRRENFFKVEAIPILGTGKLDLREIKNIAQENISKKSD